MMMRRVAATTLVPPWLEPLLRTPFFATCPLHPDAARSECNMFCIDCATAAFCFYCRSERHSGHRVIQIRRSSYHDVVRVSEVQKVLDISGVQTYVINSARVLFLNERPQPRGSGSKSHGHGGAAGASSSSAHTCEICARSLLDPYRFCSLGCKLVGIRRNGDATFVVDDGDDDDQGSGVGIGSSSAAAASAAAAEYTAKRMEGLRGRAGGGAAGGGGGGGGGSREGMGHEMRLPPPNSRRRKGIPHRAPFAS